MVEEYRQAQARLPEIEQDFASRHPDYLESVARLQPGRETPIPPTAYLHTVMSKIQRPLPITCRKVPKPWQSCGAWKRADKASKSSRS